MRTAEPTSHIWFPRSVLVGRHGIYGVGPSSVSRELIIPVLINGTQERDRKAPSFQANNLAHCAHTCRNGTPLSL
jgi:hypothetical protein